MRIILFGLSLLGVAGSFLFIVVRACMYLYKTQQYFILSFVVLVLSILSGIVLMDSLIESGDL